jgi:glycosyltransferase involved in cell wall biosynthesis
MAPSQEAYEQLMRIALVGDYPLNPREIHNGPQAVFAYLLEGLEQMPDLDIHVITAKRQLHKPSSKKADGVTYHFLPYPLLPTELSFFILRRRIHQLLNSLQPQLVHAQSALRYGAMCLSAGFPTIVTPHNVHGTEVPFTAVRVTRFRVRLHFAVTRRYFVKNARFIVSISPYIRRHYEPLVNATFFDIDNPVSDAFFGLDPAFETANSILCVGMLRTRKRPDLALAALALALKKAPELHLSFAGAPVETALHRRLQTFIIENQLQDNVSFLGQLTQDGLLDVYQTASIFLQSSDLETSPMAVEQAMAAGKPVVATDAGGTRYLMHHRHDGFVVERANPKALANFLIRLVHDDDLRRTVGDHARQTALTRFNSAGVAAKTRDMYQQVLNHGGA